LNVVTTLFVKKRNTPPYSIAADLSRNQISPTGLRVIATNDMGDQVAEVPLSPEIIVATWKAAKPHIKGLSEQQVRDYLLGFSAMWSELFPAEQARLVQLLVDRVQITAAGLDITLRTDGLTSLIQELRPAPDNKEAA
jgi:hypothetical protein